MLCVFFSFSLHVFSTDTSCDSEYLKSYQSYIGFFEIYFVCYYHYNCLAPACQMCLARTPGVELPVTLFVCMWL